MVGNEPRQDFEVGFAGAWSSVAFTDADVAGCSVRVGTVRVGAGDGSRVVAAEVLTSPNAADVRGDEGEVGGASVVGRGW